MLVSAIILYGCIKEYSYEGGLGGSVITDTLQPPVTPPPSPEFAICQACNGQDRFEENRWSFKAGNSFVCGIIDTGIINSERNAFTFFGPSACTMDTSMAVSVYLETDHLNRNHQGLVVRRIAFYFNKFGLSDHLLINRPGTPFSVTINSYDHGTKMTIGTFQGNAFRPDGSALAVEGKFMVKLH